MAARALAAEVKRLGARVVDRGAADMARAEARDACERLARRCEGTVVTKEARRRDVFARREGAEGALERFLGGNGPAAEIGTVSRKGVGNDPAEPVEGRGVGTGKDKVEETKMEDGRVLSG